jgi:hypothetical protein
MSMGNAESDKRFVKKFFNFFHHFNAPGRSINNYNAGIAYDKSAVALIPYRQIPPAKIKIIRDTEDFDHVSLINLFVLHNYRPLTK